MLPVIAVHPHRTRRGRCVGPHPTRPAVPCSRTSRREHAVGLRRTGPVPDAGHHRLLDLRASPAHMSNVRLSDLRGHRCRDRRSHQDPRCSAGPPVAIRTPHATRPPGPGRHPRPRRKLSRTRWRRAHRARPHRLRSSWRYESCDQSSADHDDRGHHRRRPTRAQRALLHSWIAARWRRCSDGSMNAARNEFDARVTICAVLNAERRRGRPEVLADVAAEVGGIIGVDRHVQPEFQHATQWMIGQGRAPPAVSRSRAGTR